jgi:presenilin-like A22 family membrane protease
MILKFIFSNYYWIIPVIFFYIFSAYSSIRINQGSNSWFFINWLVGLIPFWGLVAKYSKNVVFDGIVYDIVMTVTYLVAICIMTRTFENFSLIKILGIVVVLGGLLMLKVG